MTAAQERKKYSAWFVTNHWGWGLKGIKTWINYGWGIPYDKWKVERPDGSFMLLFKIGPICTRLK